MMRITFLYSLWIILCATGICFAQQPKAGTVNSAPFTFKAANGETVEGEKGTLLVPENRTRAGSRLIELSYMRLKSRSSNPGVPTIYLVGGPGGNAIQQVTLLFSNYSHILEAGDLIVLDQRGTGNSKPNLRCVEKVIYPLGKPIDSAEFLHISLQASETCAKTLRSSGIDLDGYNTIENADDVEALRRALNIEKWNIFGTSYGTHLGFSVIRRHGKHINRIILAGVEGPDHTYKLPSQIDRNFADMEALVRNAPDIGRSMPELIRSIQTIGERLEKHPVSVETHDSQSRRNVTIVLGKRDFQLYLATFPGRVARIKTLPASIYAMLNGDFSDLAKVSILIRREDLGSAMSFMMDCASGYSARRMARIEKEKEQSLVGEMIDFPFPGVCKAWGARDLGAKFRSPVKSRLPVLFISGDLDGRTPAANVEEIRAGFPNSHHLVVENAGHADATMFTPKTKEAMVQFLKGTPPAHTRVPSSPVAFTPLR